MLSTETFELPSRLISKAQANDPVTMAIVGADHPVARDSAKQATDAGLIIPTLIGDATTIRKLAEHIEWDLSKIQIVNAAPEEATAHAAAALASRGEVQALMKGQIHTDALMRGVLNRDAGLRTDRRLSHVFHMTVPGSDQALMITDGAVNVAPDEKTMMDIVHNAVGLAHALGYEKPKVAMLSGSESVMESMPSTVLSARIVERAKAGKIENADVDGPFALDNAISPAAAELKGITGPVAGQADILAVPNIEMGNGLFKSLVYFRSALAAGIVLGAKVPIVLTSRADPPEARLAATAIAQIRAAYSKN
jgi:phosphate acetyltransferase